MLTREYIPGKGWIEVDASFRRYSSPQESSVDWWRLMQGTRYAPFRNAPDFDTAMRAMGESGYATDPDYGKKLAGIRPQTPEQIDFFNKRLEELRAGGVPEHLAQVAARQSALETGWGRSVPGQNYYGIKLASAGRSDAPQPFSMEERPVPTMPPIEQFDYALPPEEPQGLFAQLAGHPLFSMGLGILGSNTGHYGQAMPAIGRGAMLGMQNWQGMQEAAALNEIRKQRLQEAMLKRQEEAKQDSLDKQRAERFEFWLAGQPEDVQQMLRANPGAAEEYIKGQLREKYGPKAQETWGVTPYLETDPMTGELYEVRYSSTGQRMRNKTTGVPFGYEKQQPEFIKKQAGARETGTVEAKQEADFREKYGEGMRQVDETMAHLEYMAKLPGKAAAVGPIDARTSTFFGPTVTYEGAFNQLKGMGFLSNIQQMRGLGQLSDAEGLAIREAYTDLSLAQDEESHNWSMARIYANLERGNARLKARKELGKDEAATIGAARDPEVRAAYEKLFGRKAARPQTRAPTTAAPTAEPAGDEYERLRRRYLQEGGF